MSEETTNKDLLEEVRRLMPADAGVTKVDFEGPDVAVYVNNVSFVYKDESIIRNISVAIKKRLIVRSESSKLMDPESAVKRIKEIVPPEAGIPEEGIRFVPEFSEVYIEALKPGLVIGKGGTNLINIISDTKWIPKVLRIPTMNSDVIKGVRNMLF